MSTDTDRDAREYPADPERRVPAAEGVERAVWEALRGVEDPEMPVSVVDLGLIYDVAVEDGHVDVDLTVTYSGCPARERIRTDVERAARAVDGVESVEVSVVYGPPWSVERVTDRGRQALGEYGLAVPESAGTPADDGGEDPECY